jgi:hypothetical protein
MFWHFIGLYLRIMDLRAPCLGLLGKALVQSNGCLGKALSENIATELVFWKLDLTPRTPIAHSGRDHFWNIQQWKCELPSRLRDNCCPFLFLFAWLTLLG